RCPRPRKRSWPRLLDDDRCGRLWKTRSLVFQAAVDGALSVHGRGSVHTVYGLTNDVSEFPPLDGTLPAASRAATTPHFRWEPREVRRRCKTSRIRRRIAVGTWLGRRERTGCYRVRGATTIREGRLQSQPDCS